MSLFIVTTTAILTIAPIAVTSTTSLAKTTVVISLLI